MEIKKVLWLEDQYEDFGAYKSFLFRAGYVVDTIPSVSEAVKKLREQDYTAIILDIKVLPGDDEVWKDIDKEKREKNPNFDSYLGLELIHSLLNPDNATIRLTPPILIDPIKIIVLSIVVDKPEEISSLGIPGNHIVYKSNFDSDTLPKLIEEIEKQTGSIHQQKANKV